jgi:signal transduction histidine kinase/ActR/RegA family two-component response regulator
MKQLTQQDVFTFTNSVRLPDGSLRQEQLQFSYQDAETLFYCMSDITVQFTHENAQLAELAAAKMAADKANQYKSNFLSSMSHDLRTPLNGIIGFTNLALQTEDVKKKQDFLQKIKSSGELLEDLVNDTLELSRIESGKQVLEPATVVEKDFWDGVVTAMVPSAQMKNLQLQTEYVALQDELISLDKVKAKKILLNLISNAIKYTPQGGRIKVSVKALEPPEHGCSRRLVVEDTGIGMSPEFLERMYEPFSQEHRPEARNVTGTGLGLAIVKMNVDLMGGTIQAVSKVGHGTRFTVDLPVEHWTRAAVAEPASAQKPELDWRRLAGCKVLVCEDNYLNAEIATLLLKDKQMEVDWAQDGQQGLEKFRDSLPGYYDLILMDIRMPVLDGYKATRAIRKLARPDAATVPIVAMTANAFEEDLQEAEAAGMNAYITKPVNPQHLYQTLLEVKKG